MNRPREKERKGPRPRNQNWICSMECENYLHVKRTTESQLDSWQNYNVYNISNLQSNHPLKWIFNRPSSMCLNQSICALILFDKISLGIRKRICLPIYYEKKSNSTWNSIDGHMIRWPNLDNFDRDYSDLYWIAGLLTELPILCSHLFHDAFKWNSFSDSPFKQKLKTFDIFYWLISFYTNVVSHFFSRM